MTDSAGAFDDLVAHARDTRVVVVGAGIAGLVAALECAKVGMRVTVVEASDRLGGAVRAAEVAGLRLDTGAEGFATRGGVVRALIDDVGLGDAVVPCAPDLIWVAGPAADPAPLPRESLAGIPENLWDERVRHVIGWRGTWRAYVDRLRPPLTIGQERSLGRLVRSRMGDRVLDGLVAPLSLGRFAIHPDNVDVEAIAPGLSAALTNAGSLSGAVADLRSRPGIGAEAGAAIAGIDGGMARLVDVLHARLIELGADVRVSTPVTRLEQHDGHWRVVTDVAPEHDAASGGPDSIPVPAPVLEADAVVVATDEATARRLLSPHAPGVAESAAASGPMAPVALEVLTLVVDNPDPTPAPTAVYAVPGVDRAAAVTDSTARWEWVAHAAGPGTRVLRVTFGGPGVAPATAGMNDTDAAARAVAAASALLGLAPTDLTLRGAHRERFIQPPPASVLGHADASGAVRTAIRAVPGLAAVGAWLAGTGLAQVVPDAIEEAERVRRDALWGSSGT